MPDPTPYPMLLESYPLGAFLGEGDSSGDSMLVNQVLDTTPSMSRLCWTHKKVHGSGQDYVKFQVLVSGGSHVNDGGKAYLGYSTLKCVTYTNPSYSIVLPQAELNYPVALEDITYRLDRQMAVGPYNLGDVTGYGSVSVNLGYGYSESGVELGIVGQGAFNNSLTQFNSSSTEKMTATFHPVWLYVDEGYSLYGVLRASNIEYLWNPNNHSSLHTMKFVYRSKYGNTWSDWESADFGSGYSQDVNERTGAWAASFDTNFSHLEYHEGHMIDLASCRIAIPLTRVQLQYTLAWVDNSGNIDWNSPYPTIQTEDLPT